MASRRTQKQNMLRQYEREMKEIRQEEELQRLQYEEWYEEWKSQYELEYDYDDYDDFSGRYAYGY